MGDAIDVVTRHVDGAVNDEARDIDVVVGRVERACCFGVDLDQAGGVDLLIEHAVGVDQELVVMTWDAAGDVVRDHLGIAVQRNESVRRSEIDAGIPFSALTCSRTDLTIFDGGCIDRAGSWTSPFERDIFWQQFRLGRGYLQLCCIARQ